MKIFYVNINDLDKLENIVIIHIDIINKFNNKYLGKDYYAFIK